MAIAGIPPWESFGFPDVLNFGVRGAQLGLEKASQTIGANEAADRLRLGYAQLESENQRSAAAQAGEGQRASAADALARFKELNDLEIARQNASAMNAYRGGELASRQFRDALAFHNAQRLSQPAPAPEVQFANVNGRLIPYLVDKKTGRGTWAPSGALTVDKPGTLTPVDRERLRQFRTELSGLTKKWADPAMVRKASADPNSATAKEYNSDKARIKILNDQINSLLPARPTSSTGAGGSSAADALTAPNSTPPADAQNDPLGILSGTDSATVLPNE